MGLVGRVLIAIPVPLDKVDAVWPRVLPHIERAITPESGASLDDVNRMIHNKEAQLWAVVDGRETVGAAVIQLDAESVHIFLLGGVRWAEWRSELSKIYELARLAGVSRVSCGGRRAWARLLAPDGFVKDGNGDYVKDLT